MDNRKWRAAVVTLSDKGYAGEREDKSGPLVCELLREAGYDVEKSILLPDEQKEIEKSLCKLCDEDRMDIIFTTGGTGFSPRDCTPEATLAVATKNAPGIAEAMRLASLKAVRENLEAVLPSLQHGLEILTGQSGECGDQPGGARR